MRKHDVRKWLHAVLDLLPIIVIPVFMVYSHRHNVTENVQVQYKYQSNEVNSLADLVEGNIYYLSSMQLYTTSGNSLTLSVLKSSGIDNFPINNIYDDLYQDEDSNGILTFYWSNDDTLNIEFNSATLIYSFLDENYQYDLIVYNLDFIYTDDLYSYFVTNNYLPQYTDYNVIESVDIENTDVMDSFMNHFNNTIDKHFNMGNVFNLNGVYQWFNTNIFNGNAPQVIFSIWNIALYELVMDLLFLLYGLFMWFIDMVQKLMDKPLNSVK